MNVPFLMQTCRLVADGQGGSVTEWSTKAAFWGALEDFADRVIKNMRDDVTHIVTTRKRDDLAVEGEARLVYGNPEYGERIFAVREIRMVGRGEGRTKIFVREQRYLN